MKTLTKHLNTLKEENAGIFVPYIMAGDHALGLDGLEETLLYLEELGASAIEVGIPFSDPVADGPVIQEAAIRALENETSLKAIIAQLQTIKVKTPLILMTYFNPVFVYGVEKFVADLEHTAVKGLIVPDVPFEHSEMITRFTKDSDLSLIPLVSLTTDKERMKMLVNHGEGFVYTVAINGVTGTKSDYSDKIFENLSFLTENSTLPVLAGFGISSIEQAQAFRKHCDGVIVGSYIVDGLNKGKKTEISDFVRKLLVSLKK
ncbi:tryptophan synthase, alpha chain [Pilibacter termitis]|jgi:tryptophan synthase alpha chain|uniref:Tryptophan synthase alpha chain n=1 Tax=Pilibacter termitis TaxID=263852 RepID=A0A1T4QC59_9ENTE|nr:tryptophan synthase subunit alpha [Pilibacter termitis]SKA01217.1 tryptophan synthase, alpha chain [Pilibacter termitis]